MTSEETWKTIAERTTLKTQKNSAQGDHPASLSVLYLQKHRKFKNQTRIDKCKFIEAKAEQAEESAKKGVSRLVYKITNDIVGRAKVPKVQ